jgi:hypothetical protein
MKTQIKSHGRVKTRTPAELASLFELRVERILAGLKAEHDALPAEVRGLIYSRPSIIRLIA